MTDFPPSLKLFLDDLDQDLIQADVADTDQILTLKSFAQGEAIIKYDNSEPVSLGLLYKLYCDRCYSHYQIKPSLNNATQFKKALMIHSHHVVDREDNVAFLRAVYSS